MAKTLHLRWADAQTQARFPASCELSARLRRGQASIEVAVPALTAGDMLIPSFAAARPEPYEFQFSLNGVDLPAVPSHEANAGADAPEKHQDLNPQLRTHLDWFEALQAIPNPTLSLRLRPELLNRPHLLSISIRPIQQPVNNTPVPSKIHAGTPPALSQRQASADISGRICSPTAVAMVLQHHGYPIDWLELVRQCRDPASGMYGLWPLCILRAAQTGCLGAVQAFSGWDEVTPFLAADLPVVASIRYGKDQLPGSPMPSTGGHLVVVFGVDERWVLVNDPAALDRSTVTLRYPRAAFEKAWFEHRGAGYVLLP